MYTQLTEKQKKVLEFLKRFTEKKGFPPTLREIASHFGSKSPRGPQKILRSLEQKGYIKKLSRSSRAIEIIGDPLWKKDISNIPILGQVRAGEPLLAEENIEGYLQLDRSICYSEEMFLLRVSGDSMVGAHIIEGDLALINPHSDLKNGDLVVALLQDGATIKRFFKDKGEIRLEAENPAFNSIIIKKGQREIKILGKVVGIIRRL